MQNTTLTSILNSKKQPKLSNKNVIIMDEIDGMSGTEDKGGVNALINIIKQTKMPIICICNNRNNPKLSTLLKNCFEIKFTKPDKNASLQMLGNINSHANLGLQFSELESILESSNYDFRQCMNLLESTEIRKKIKNDNREKNNTNTNTNNNNNTNNSNYSFNQKDKNQSLTPFEAGKIFLSKYEVCSLLSYISYI